MNKLLLGHLVPQPVVVWERPLVGRQSPEHGWEAELPDHVDEGPVDRLPVQRREAVTFLEDAETEFCFYITLTNFLL